MSTLDYAIVMEELSRVDAGVALSVAAHNSLCSGHIFLAGTEEQKKKYLVPLATGREDRLLGPHREQRRLRRRAAPRPRRCATATHWVLNGSKTFITNGRIADTAVVMAVTDKSKGKKGISAFVVERGTKGFRSGKKEDKLGVRSSDTSELVLRGLPHPRREPPRQGGQRLRRHAAHPRPRPHRHRRLVAGHRPGQPGGVA